MPPPSNVVGLSISNGPHPSAPPRCAPLNGRRVVRFETADATRRSRSPPRLLGGTQNRSGRRHETALPLHSRIRPLIQGARCQRKRDPPGIRRPLTDQRGDDTQHKKRTGNPSALNLEIHGANARDLVHPMTIKHKIQWSAHSPCL